MLYGDVFESQIDEMEFLMSTNEVYFGQTEQIKLIESTLDKLRKHYMNSRRLPKNDPDLLTLNHLIEEHFGFGKFNLLIVFNPIPGAVTMPIEYSIDLETKLNNYAVDPTTYKFKKELNYMCVIAMTSGLIFNDYFTTREIMACLLYELGLNFYSCFSKPYAILSNIYTASTMALQIADCVNTIVSTKNMVKATDDAIDKNRYDNAMDQSKASFEKQVALHPELRDLPQEEIQDFLNYSAQKSLNDPENVAKYEGIKKTNKYITYGGTLIEYVINHPLYRSLMISLRSKYKVSPSVRSITIGFMNYFNLAVEFIMRKITTFTGMVTSYIMNNHNIHKVLQTFNIIDTLLPVQAAISRSMNPLTYAMIPLSYHVERAANNFPTMYGYGADEVSYFEKMKSNKKMTFIRRHMEKYPFLGIMYDMVLLPSKILNGVFDPTPSGISRCYDQIALLENELTKQDLSDDIKSQILRDIRMCRKTLKSIMDLSHPMEDSDVLRKIYNRVIEDYLGGVGLKDRLFDNLKKFKQYDYTYTKKAGEK